LKSFLYTIPPFLVLQKCNLIPPAGESWKRLVERESQTSGRSHRDLARLLLSSLHNKYPRGEWLVNVYDDVSGFRNHAYRALTSNVHHLFRYFGHNIVVAKLIIERGTPSQLQNLGQIFWESYRPQCTLYGYSTTYCDVHAGRTVEATWNALKQRGVNPVMLHMEHQTVNIESTLNFDERYISSKELAGTRLATLIAVN
jgi:hypothetical protein